MTSLFWRAGSEGIWSKHPGESVCCYIWQSAGGTRRHTSPGKWHTWIRSLLIYLQTKEWIFQGLNGGNVFKNKLERTFHLWGFRYWSVESKNKQKMTEEFINTMYSMSRSPQIIRPSRVASHCATIMDKIFTNEIENNTISTLFTVWW